MTAPFQLFDALDAATESALTESIRRFGVLVPVVRDQHGNVLDGHHRARIADTLGVKYPVSVIRVADDAEAREIARTLNADRRQLDAEQRRAMVRQRALGAGVRRLPRLAPLLSQHREARCRMTAPECRTCGHPSLRPDGHASFCESWNVANASPTLTLVAPSAASGSGPATVEPGAVVSPQPKEMA